MPYTDPPYLTNYWDVQFDSQSAPLAVIEDVVRIDVQNSWQLVSECNLQINDTGFGYLLGTTSASPLIALGKRLTIRAGWKSVGNLGTLFDGDIVALNYEITTEGVPLLTVTAQTKDWKVRRGRNTKTFVNQTHKDIVTAVADANSLTVNAATSGGSATAYATEVHPWIIQDNRDDWSFMNDLALQNGFNMYLADYNTLYFQPAETSADSAVTLSWQSNLLKLQIKESVASQYSEVVVQSWDPKTKQQISSTANTGAGGDLPELEQPTPVVSSANILYVVNRNINSQDEANALAQALFDNSLRERLTVEGECRGTPELLPGVWAILPDIGPNRSGKYRLTSTTHTIIPNEDYTTGFLINKRESVADALHEDDGGQASETRAGIGKGALSGSIALAKVTDNNDPDKQGRVKVMYPWLSTEDTSFWARVAAPMGGSGRGFYFLPEIEDEVLVAFDQGDINRPYIIGGLWNERDAVIEGNDVAVNNAKVVHRIIKTRVGHTILLDDSDEKGLVQIKTNGGHTLTLSDTENAVNIIAQTTGGHKMTFDDTNKKIILVDGTTNNKMTIDSNNNSIALECLGDFSVTATGKVTIQGTGGIELNTPAQLKETGTAGIAMNSTGQIKADAVAGIALSASAGPTQVKSSTLVEIQGLLVKIN